MPAAYKELAEKQAALGLTWKAAQPNDAAGRGKWWTLLGDRGLDDLEAMVTISNQTIAMAEAQYRGARALVGGVRSSLFPSIGIGVSAGRSSGVTTRSPGAGQAAPAVDSFEVPVTMSWTLDIFGRIRRSVQAGLANAQASAADLEGVRLAMQAEAAMDYLALRGLDAEIDLLNRTAAGYQTALGLTENRFKQGVVSGVDVAQAKTQLDATRAQATDLSLSRAKIEHALAVLVGKPPAEFAVPPAALRIAAPDIPAGLPSELLERRPDIAAAERRMAAANAQIGVAVAGYFPSLGLSGTAGYLDSKLAGLFSLPNRLWSLGASLFETLFNGGQRRALKEQAVAAYDAAVASDGDTENFIQKPFSPDQLAERVREMLTAPGRRARILIADDDAEVRGFLRAALESGGYEVVEAANGKQALAAVRAGGVDLAIMDLVMPEQEGIETIVALRKEAPSVGIIAISGALEGPYLGMARALGAQAALSKPVSAELLLAKVAEALKARR